MEVGGGTRMPRPEIVEQNSPTEQRSRLKIEVTLELKRTSHRSGLNLEMQSKSSCGALHIAHSRATRLPSPGSTHFLFF